MCSVTHRQLRAKRDSVGGTDGRLVDPSGSAHHLHGPRQHLAQDEGHPAEQTRHRRQPGPSRHPRSQSARCEYYSAFVAAIAFSLHTLKPRLFNNHSSRISFHPQ